MIKMYNLYGILIIVMDMNWTNIEKFEKKVKYNKMLVKKLTDEMLYALERESYKTSKDSEKIKQEIEIISYVSDYDEVVLGFLSSLLENIDSKPSKEEITHVKKQIALLDILLNIECCFFTVLPKIDKKDIMTFYELLNQKMTRTRKGTR